MNAYLFTIQHNTERGIHDMAVWIQTHCSSEEYFAVFAVAIEEVAVVMPWVTTFWVCDRLGSLMNRIVVKRSDHDCDRSHF